MGDADKTIGSRAVKPMELVGAGGLALSLGALLGFSSHYFGAHRWQQQVPEGDPDITQRSGEGGTPGGARRAGPPAEQVAPALVSAAGTAKELVEEGLDPRARLRLLPVAVGSCSCGCFALPSASRLGWRLCCFF